MEVQDNKLKNRNCEIFILKIASERAPKEEYDPHQPHSLEKDANWRNCSQLLSQQKHTSRIDST